MKLWASSGRDDGLADAGGPSCKFNAAADNENIFCGRERNQSRGVSIEVFNKLVGYAVPLRRKMPFRVAEEGYTDGQAVDVLREHIGRRTLESKNRRATVSNEIWSNLRNP